MQVTSTPTPNPAPNPNGGGNQVGSVRGGIAGGLRAVGDGLKTASEMTGVAADKGYIYPTESMFATGQVIDQATKKLGPVNKITGKIGFVAGYITAFDGMIVGGMMRTPGSTASDLLHAAADKIDGQSTVEGDFGFGWGGLAQARMAAAAAKK